MNFHKGAEFPYPVPVDGKEVFCKAHDTEERTWRHPGFFQYPCRLHACAPRVGNKDPKPKTAAAPWSRPGSGLTLLFESLAVELAKTMPLSEIGETAGENDAGLWRVVRHYVDGARPKADCPEATRPGMDGTSKKGHDCITVFVSLDNSKAVFVAGGKDQTTAGRFAADLVAHNGDCGKIGVATCDVSLGFKAGMATHFTNAVAIIDRFHAIKHANEAMDEARRAEAKENDILKNTRYVRLRNDDTLSDKQLKKKQRPMRKHLKTGRACMMREGLQEIHRTSANREEAETGMKKPCGWMMRSRPEPMKAVAGLIKNHREEILGCFDNPCTNAVLEGLNNVMQQIETRARGFRNDKHFTTMIYLVCGDIDLESVLAFA